MYLYSNIVCICIQISVCICIQIVYKLFGNIGNFVKLSKKGKLLAQMREFIKRYIDIFNGKVASQYLKTLAKYYVQLYLSKAI